MDSNSDIKIVLANAPILKLNADIFYLVLDELKRTNLPTLHQFSAVSRQCREVAAPFIFKRLTIEAPKRWDKESVRPIVASFSQLSLIARYVQELTIRSGYHEVYSYVIKDASLRPSSVVEDGAALIRDLLPTFVSLNLKWLRWKSNAPIPDDLMIDITTARPDIKLEVHLTVPYYCLDAINYPTKLSPSLLQSPQLSQVQTIGYWGAVRFDTSTGLRQLSFKLSSGNIYHVRYDKTNYFDLLRQIPSHIIEGLSSLDSIVIHGMKQNVDRLFTDIDRHRKTLQTLSFHTSLLISSTQIRYMATNYLQLRELHLGVSLSCITELANGEPSDTIIQDLKALHNIARLRIWVELTSEANFFTPKYVRDETGTMPDPILNLSNAKRAIQALYVELTGGLTRTRHCHRALEMLDLAFMIALVEDRGMTYPCSYVLRLQRDKPSKGDSDKLKLDDVDDSGFKILQLDGENGLTYRCFPVQRKWMYASLVGSTMRKMIGEVFV